MKLLAFAFFCLTGILGAQVRVLDGCQVFPANNVWNTAIDTLPVAANSAAYVQTLGATSPLHPDYGATGGTGLAVVTNAQASVPVKFYYTGDPGPYPIPSNPPIEAGGDHHLFILNTDTCIDYELFNIQKQSNGSWLAGSGWVLPWNSNVLHPDGMTSADAAGLPMIQGHISYDEILAGQINHALRFTGIATASSHIWPARHNTSSYSGSSYAPMGQRFRLKANVDISRFPVHVQTILVALKKYGMILADNGTSWHIQGLVDSRWNDDEMHTMTGIVGADFEAIDESSLIIDPNSAAAKQPNSVIPPPTGPFSFVSERSGQCLSVTDTAATNYGLAPGAKMQQWPCTGAVNQKFTLIPVAGGFEIVNQGSNLDLNVAGGPAATWSGALIQQWPYRVGGSGVFNIGTADSNGYFEITAVTSGKCFDVISSTDTGHALNPGTLIQQYTCWGGAMQKWKLQ